MADMAIVVPVRSLEGNFTDLTTIRTIQLQSTGTFINDISGIWKKSKIRQVGFFEYVQLSAHDFFSKATSSSLNG